VRQAPAHKDVRLETDGYKAERCFDVECARLDSAVRSES